MLLIAQVNVPFSLTTQKFRYNTVLFASSLRFKAISHLQLNSDGHWSSYIDTFLLKLNPKATNYFIYMKPIILTYQSVSFIEDVINKFYSKFERMRYVQRRISKFLQCHKRIRALWQGEKWEKGGTRLFSNVHRWRWI